MNVICLQENLRRGLSLVSHAVATRSTLPALSTVLLETDQGRLKLAATDLSLGITCWIGCQIEAEGAVAVPARLLNDFVASLPNEPVHIELDPRTRGLHLQCLRYEAEVKGLDPLEFPGIPTMEGADPTVLADPVILREAIGQVVFAASSEDTRPAMTGVLVRIQQDRMTLVAADGFRLALRTLDLLETPRQEFEAIVPAKAMAELVRILSDQEEPTQIVLTPNLNQILFHCDSVDLVSNLVEARYPDYQAIIPPSYETRATLATSEFLKAVRISSFFARDGANIIRLEVQPTPQQAGGQLIVSASASEVGSNVTQLDTSIEGEGGIIAFNARYLTEVLSATNTAEVALEMQAGDRPGVFKPVGRTDQVHVIMPMQLEQW
ncbi:MAG: DNA polymerase III subunit beta [Chloroflexia bacterium]|nr:DNA polymerase III subunit beta [Chloroflexia bacterium]